jgi:phytoene dehydrogenase-like protein
VTEEIIPSFKFSRASYLAGLLRPQIIQDLNLQNYGFKYIPRDPSSFTPTLEDKYLMLGSNDEDNWKSIAQFSKKDADSFLEYEKFLHRVREIVNPILDGPPINPFEGTGKQKFQTLKQMADLTKVLVQNKDVIVPLYELFCSPASQILDRWFESEILKTTLATDAVIGAMVSPTQATSSYVLLHHVMGESAGREGVWAYVEGGMGSISNAIAASGKELGVEICCNAVVKEITYRNENGKARATGVLMQDGTHISADIVISNATPYHTFLELLPGLATDVNSQGCPLPKEFVRHIRHVDYSCGEYPSKLLSHLQFFGRFLYITL